MTVNALTIYHGNGNGNCDQRPTVQPTTPFDGLTGRLWDGFDERPLPFRANCHDGQSSTSIQPTARQPPTELLSIYLHTSTIVVVVVAALSWTLMLVAHVNTLNFWNKDVDVEMYDHRRRHVMWGDVCAVWRATSYAFLLRPLHINWTGLESMTFLWN